MRLPPVLVLAPLCGLLGADPAGAEWTRLRGAPSADGIQGDAVAIELIPDGYVPKQTESSRKAALHPESIPLVAGGL